MEHWFVQGHDFRLSQQPGIHVKTVATALEIHPFMLSKWRKDARDGRLRGRAPKAPPPHRLLVTAGWSVSRRRVARLMRMAGLRAKAVRGYRAKVTVHAVYARHSRGAGGISPS